MGIPKPKITVRFASIPDFIESSEIGQKVIKLGLQIVYKK